MDAASLALIAHDLKNALGALEGQLAGLIDEPTPAGAQSAYVHCTELRRQFIQFLTLYGPGQALQALCEDESPIELLASLQRLAQLRQLNQPDCRRLQIDLAAERAAERSTHAAQSAPPYWYFDRRLVHMALDAALHNASRFAHRRITLGTRVQEACLVFSIDDDGPGLGAVDPSCHSTGLGTSLCKAVAHAHHNGAREGRITLANLPEGGTRFELWLP